MNEWIIFQCLHIRSTKSTIWVCCFSCFVYVVVYLSMACDSSNYGFPVFSIMTQRSGLIATISGTNLLILNLLKKKVMQFLFRQLLKSLYGNRIVSVKQRNDHYYVSKPQFLKKKWGKFGKHWFFWIHCVAKNFNSFVSSYKPLFYLWIK